MVVALGARRADAFTFDERGEIRLGLRAYNAVRIGTEVMGGKDDPLSFPVSDTGHVRQHRYFLSIKLDHDILRLAKTGRGLAALFGWLDPTELRYSVQYRGEGDGIYDYGPDEFSHLFRTTKAVRTEAPDIPGLSSPIPPNAYIRPRVARIDRNSRQRHRLFLAYLDFERGPIFVRIGRQILAWGETDQFRLLDNINPLDNGFGGFLIPLDERRVPLDMLRMSYHLGDPGPFSDVFVEAFGAMGNRTSINPGIPPGSPWIPGGLGFPNTGLKTVIRLENPDHFRGGARIVFNHRDVTYSLAYYQTRLDNPGIRFRIPGQLDGVNIPRFGNEVIAEQITPRVPITGGSLTFPLPQFYAVVRSEAAWIVGEPFNRQGRGKDFDSLGEPGSPGYQRLVAENNIEGGLDPFLYPGFYDLSRVGPIQGRLLQRDTFNFSLGLDVNRFIRWLNPRQTIFFSAQLFYKHVFDSPGDLVLPVPHHNIPVATQLPIAGTFCGDPPANGRPCRVRPRLFDLNDDQFLNTLLITTSYYGGRIVPQIGLFYDWQGVVVIQPGVTLVRDPFRLVMDYTQIGGPPTGQLGTLRDRDNVRFQAEYVF